MNPKRPIQILCLITMVLLTGCNTREDKARTILNEAMLAWTQRDTQQTFAKLEQVITQYPETRAATEAIDKREQLEGGYRSLYSEAANAAVNKRDFAAAVWRSVLAYKKSHGRYPTALVETDIAQDTVAAPFLTNCTYEKAPRNLGVKLDCTPANIMVTEYFADTGELSQYIDAERNKPKNQREPIKKMKVLSDFPQANNTWGDTLNSGGRVPERGFSAFYINTGQPRKVIAKVNTEAIAMHYSYNDFHHIPSEDFGAYWVGYLIVPKAAAYYFALGQSWAKSRIILDKHVIYEAGGRSNAKPPSLYLQPGKYLLEFEYINNWHTVNVQLNVLPEIAILDEQTVFTLIQKLSLPPQTAVYAASVYESRNDDNHVTLKTTHTEKPFILMLSSYRAVRWQIEGEQPSVVIYNNANKGSTVNTTAGDLIAWRGSIPYNFKNKSGSCSCVAGIFHCEDRSATPIQQTEKISQALTGFKLTGVSGNYGGKVLLVPEVMVNATSIAEEKNKQKAQEAKKEACTRKAHPDFENMMQN